MQLGQLDVIVGAPKEDARRSRTKSDAFGDCRQERYTLPDHRCLDQGVASVPLPELDKFLVQADAQVLEAKAVCDILEVVTGSQSDHTRAQGHRTTIC